jgi:hypothetical protein
MGSECRIVNCVNNGRMNMMGSNGGVAKILYGVRKKALAGSDSHVL